MFYWKTPAAVAAFGAVFVIIPCLAQNPIDPYAVQSRAHPQSVSGNGNFGKAGSLERPRERKRSIRQQHKALKDNYSKRHNGLYQD